MFGKGQLFALVALLLALYLLFTWLAKVARTGKSHGRGFVWVALVVCTILAAWHQLGGPSWVANRHAHVSTRSTASASVNRDWVHFGTIPPGRKAKILSPTDVVVRDVWPGGSSISTGDIMTYAGRPFAIDVSVRADTVNGAITFTLM